MKLKLNQLQQPVAKSFTPYLNPLGTALGIFYFKRILVFLFGVISINATSQTSIKITEAKYNFGFVKRGEVVEFKYEAINTGKEPFIITEAEVSCSCTEVEFSKQPVLPGQKTLIRVIFNTKTVYGRQDRIVLIHSNATNSPVKLRYKGTVSKN